MDELQSLIESELLKQLVGNYTLPSTIPAVAATGLQNPAWQSHLKLALGLDEEHTSSDNPQHCTKSKMPFLSATLVATAYSVGGKDPREILPVLAGVFYIQQASSILDDIQDGDRADSLDKLLNVPTALNIALLLLSRGQELLTDRLITTAPAYLPLINTLNQTVGTALQGQLQDLAETSLPLTSRTLTKAQYITKIAAKTGTRFSFLSELGVLLGGVEVTKAECYRQFGFIAGIVLHMLSDLYDFAGAGEGVIEQSRDYLTGVFNLPLLCGYEAQPAPEAKAEFLQLWQQSLESADYLPAFKAQLNWQAAYNQTIATIEYYLGEAEKALRHLDPELSQPAHRELLWLLQQHLMPEAISC